MIQKLINLIKGISAQGDKVSYPNGKILTRSTVEPDKKLSFNFWNAHLYNLYNTEL